ncbi:tetratricopeptide repeat protein [Bradyrhizobium sp. BR13661]|uniref:tetratricopeptide repeat protein n=1 Tax=Bradyrhizobium sp. BR13661 TaxID=2940622 RepID=UPI002476C02B|nr:tetratricopeptide repeat protein [Bradyrhizobium sp. BR13661]
MFHYLSADAAARRSQFDRAIDRLSDVIALDPGNPAAYHDRGVAQQGLGNYRGSLDDFDKAIALSPRMARAYSSRGISWKLLGDFDRAIADQTQAVALSPWFAEAYSELGVAYLCKPDFYNAVHCLTEAIHHAPKNAGNVKQRGIALYCRGDFKAAIPDLQRAFDTTNDIYALLFLHLARANSRENASAALEIDAVKVRSWAWPSAVVGLFLGRLSAEETIAAAGTPDERAEAQFYLGQQHLLRGDHAEARKALEAATQTCPPWFNEHLAAVADLQRLG